MPIETGSETGNQEKKGPPTKEEIEQSIQSMSDEEKRLFNTIRSSITVDETKAGVAIGGREDYCEPYVFQDVEPAQENYDNLVTESGIDTDLASRFEEASSNDVRKARESAITRFKINNLFLTQPATIPMGFRAFDGVRLPHEGVRRVMEIMTQLRVEQEKIIGIIRLLNATLQNKFNLELKGLELQTPREIAEKKEGINREAQRVKNPEAPNAIHFEELRTRYSRYFEGDKALDDVPINSKHRIFSEAFREDYNNNFSRMVNYRPELVPLMSKEFENERIIDLGCGPKADSMARRSLRWGATEYVGVDKYHLASDVNDHGKRNNVGCIAIKDDMLTFLEQEPSNSATILINGLDEFVLPGNVSGMEQYLQKLAIEIARVIGKDHQVIGIESYPVFSQLKKVGLNSRDFGFPDGMSFQFFRKGQKLEMNELFSELLSKWQASSKN